MKSYLFLKRSIDISFSFFVLVMIGPLFLVIALIIKIDSRGPVFFHQQRVGKNNKPFFMIKFRSMRTDAPRDVPTHLLNEPNSYITSVGKFLRKSSLDELPQFFNILLGHMSIVGPRPALCNQYDLLEKREQLGANSIRPGLTGWAQINGRDELSVQKKSELDGEYVKNMGIKIDTLCFFGTFLKVLVRSGVIEGATGETREEEVSASNSVSLG